MIEDFEDFYNHTPPEGVLPVGSTTGFARAKHRSNAFEAERQGRRVMALIREVAGFTS